MRERMFLHDAFFRTALQADGVLQELVETVAGLKLEVESFDTQVSIDNPGAHSIILDSVCREKDGSIWNVELQNYCGPDLVKRMNFYASVLTARSLKQGMEYGELPKVCVIFITPEDVLKLGKDVYTWRPQLVTNSPEEEAEIAKRADEIAAFLDDGCRKYIVNASARTGSLVSKLCEELTSPDLIYPEIFPKICQMKRELLGEDNRSEEMVGLVDEYDLKNWNNAQDALTRKYIALFTRLTADGRAEDALKAGRDPAYRDELIAYYFPHGIPEN